MVEIREFATGDAEGLFGLFAHWDRAHQFSREEFSRSLSEIASNPDYRILLAVEEGAIIGYAQLGKLFRLGFKPVLEVLQILVDDCQRGRGIGGRLMAAAEAAAREMGLGAVILSSQVHRSRAHVFYEGLGYTLEKVSKFYIREFGSDGPETR